MSKNYDNWGRLVRAVLRRESDRRLAYNHSRDFSLDEAEVEDEWFDEDENEWFMSKNYDNWERLVMVVLRRESDRQLALTHCSEKIYRTCDDDDNILPKRTIQLLPLYYSYLVRTGNDSLMLGARKLLISWEDTSSCWKWTTHDHSRFPEVVELKYVWWLKIRGSIKTRMLSPKIDYAAFLVFNLAEGCRGLEQAKGMVRFLDESSENDAEKGARVLNLLVAVSRPDGWMEIEMGSFYVDQGNEREVEAQLLENRCNLKSGLIVEGIEFRPV